MPRIPSKKDMALLARIHDVRCRTFGSRGGARFARTLATLLQNGVTLLKALFIVKDTMSNQMLANGVEKVAASLKEGESLAEPLARFTSFPTLSIHMIRVGEETGNLQEILMHVATTYDRDTQTTIKRALALLEPALILVLGVIIAAVIISIMVAILSVNELVICFMRTRCE